MGFEQSTDLKFYEKGRKKIEFGQSTDLKSYENKR